jgi:hypothetical protein
MFLDFLMFGFWFMAVFLVWLPFLVLMRVVFLAIGKIR